MPITYPTFKVRLIGEIYVSLPAKFQEAAAVLFPHLGISTDWAAFSEHYYHIKLSVLALSRNVVYRLVH